MDKDEKSTAQPHNITNPQMVVGGTKTRRKLYLDGAERETRALPRQLEEMGANGLQLNRGKVQLAIQAACCFSSFIGFYWLLNPKS